MQKLPFKSLRAHRLSLFIFAVLGVLGILGLFILTRVTSGSPITQAILTEEALPESWTSWTTVTGLPPEELRGAQLAATTEFQSKDSRAFAVHDVFQYANALWAAYFFRIYRSEDYYAAGRSTSWQAPVGWTYRSPSADEFELRCADFTAHPESDSQKLKSTCVARARYGARVSVFSLSFEPEMIPAADLQSFLRAIDDNFSQRVNSQPLPH